jgi:hypothetical protein
VAAATDLLGILRAVAELAAEHREIAARAQASRARVASVEITLQAIESLTPTQGLLLREAVQAASFGLYRASLVAAFASLMEGLHSTLESHASQLAERRPKWRLSSGEDVRDHADSQVIDVAREVGAISRSAAKSMQGLLHRRNRCAHPTGYDPTLDEALGFLSEVVQLVRTWQAGTVTRR